MILIFLNQSRIILYLILEMNWLICGKICLFPKKNEYGANLHNLWFYIAENIQKLIIFPQSCWPW
jgi:hypothetical protein